MKHLGDITKLNGAELEPVDVVTGGSPCQDLSVAGKRAGLAGERSGLYMEQIRIIKEMREADAERAVELRRPRFMVWENVSGAFSSNGGEDFKAVLEEAIRVADPEAPDLPMPDKNKWTTAGCVYDGLGKWSIAWRVHDAQFWGVPQRRRRISLVADFGGMSAPEILFERKGVSGDFETSRAAREGIAENAEGSVGNTVRCLTPWDCQASRIFDPECAFNTLSARRDSGTDNQAICIQGNCIDRADTAMCNGRGWTEDVSYTLNTIDRHAVFVEPQTTVGCKPTGKRECFQNTGIGWWNQSDVAATLRTPCGGDSTKANLVIDRAADDSMGEDNGKEDIPEGAECYAIDHVITTGGNCTAQGPCVKSDMMFTLKASGCHAVCTKTKTQNDECNSYVAFAQNQRDEVRDLNNIAGALAAEPGMKQQTFIAEFYVSEDKRIVERGSIVRRLTPLECERLQGFPDGWTDIGTWTDSKGKIHNCSDSARYKALGNSIAVPFWKWLSKRISAQYERDATLGSLFDGIGGFPYAWEHCNGKGSARWASEIEEFPIAVTKLRFQDDA